MRTPSRSVLAGALVLALAAPAWSKDFCIDFSLFRIVAKQFTVPGKGKCKPFTGIYGELDGNLGDTKLADSVAATLKA